MARPVRARLMKGLTDIAGLRVGHATDLDALTGCTVILCETGAVAGADIRGSASGTEEFPVMSPLHVTDVIHAVVLAGGSAFGLEAASGVRRYLEQKGVGFETRAARVPIVPCAILYDLGIGKANVRPTREMGEAAAAAATAGPVEEGAVGAGTGATVGKLFGMSRAMKSGLGSATVALEERYAGVLVSALAVVNAFGDVRDPDTGRLVAGARRSPDTMELADTARHLRRGIRGGFSRENTTLAVVATNARLSKVQATKLAQLAQNGLARAISPAHTMFDGDLVIALSIGTAEADVNALGVAAAEAVSQSILRAVRTAPTLGGLPGLRSETATR
ncbi:MAG TPA: P1 family peptidase [Bryobacteraceae bacterium]|nr:P1 family peptidase [Bryobacteraceae bacterium]